MGIVEKVKDPYEKRELERLSAELAKQAALTDYIAMMADVEIPMEEAEENVV